MTQEDIIEMARESGLVIWDKSIQQNTFAYAMPERLEAFAKLVAAKEREACAQTAEDKGLIWKSREDIAPENAKRAYMASQFIAQAIRARGNV